MSFPAYESYQESDGKWIGSLPSHWFANRIKRNTYLKARVGWKGLTSDEFQEEAFAYLVTGTDFREKFVKWDECYQVDQERFEDDPFIQLQDGDLLITKDGTIGKLAIVSDLDKPACLNSGIFVVRPTKDYTTEFMYWVLSSDLFSVFCDLESFGSTINHLYQNVFERFAFPVPSIDEQKAISTFLDVETSKIDGLVSEQRRLIELLKEKRQAVISHAVTKGLNPNAPMKPSGIQWLGDAPDHWEVYRMGVLYSDTSESGNDDLPVLQVSIHNGVSDRELTADESDRKITRIEDKSKYKRVLPNDLVYNMMRAWQGGFGTVKVEGMVSPAYVVARPKRHFMTQYIEHLFRTPQAIEQMRRYSHGVTDFRLRLYWDKFKNVRVALPDIGEQQAICDHIEEVTTKFDHLAAEAERAIELLQERRIALISAAVTGKIDVREHVLRKSA